MNTKISFLHQNRESVVTSAIILLCLILTAWFPTSNSIQTLTKNVFFLVAVPVFYIKFILKKSLEDFGFNLKNKRTGFTWGMLMLAVSLGISYLFITFTNFTAEYKLPTFAIDNFWLFLVYELIFVNIYIFVFEAFFRGFVLSTFSPKLDFWAIIIPVAVYALFLVIFKDPFVISALDIILAILAGIVAYESKSFVYSYLLGISYTILLDVYLIHSIK